MLMIAPFAPARRNQRPQRAAEPCIEDVALGRCGTSAGRARIDPREAPASAVVAAPGRDHLSPRDLAGDAPVVHLPKPRQRLGTLVVRLDADGALDDVRVEVVGELTHPNEPLPSGTAVE